MGPPRPPKELEKFSPLIGYWEGSGTVSHGPGVPPGKWTSTSHVRKVLDGHFLREDMRVDFEGEMFNAPLQFITFLGYDAQKQRFMSYTLSNMNSAESTEITWEDDHTMVSTATNFYQGKPVASRWVTKVEGDKLSYLSHEVHGSGEPYQHVKGTAKRVKNKPEARILDASHAFMTKPDPEMEKLKGLAGTYRFKGEMLMMPGMPMMGISGTTTGEFIFGGTALLTLVDGDPVQGHAYKGWHVLIWDARDKHYVSMSLNNVGEAGLEIGSPASKTELVFTCTHPWYGGIPCVRSGVMELADDGAPLSYVAHGIIGTHKPLKTFEITYSKQ